jgi:hypothetical protein
MKLRWFGESPIELYLNRYYSLFHYGEQQIEIGKSAAKANFAISPHPRPSLRPIQFQVLLIAAEVGQGIGQNRIATPRVFQEERNAREDLSCE